MVDDRPRFGDITDSGFFGAGGGDGAAALDPAVVQLVDELMADAPDGRDGLLQVLLGLQRAFDRVSWRVQELVADRYGLSPAQVAGLVSFFPKLSRRRKGRLRLDICRGSSCWLNDSDHLAAAVKQEVEDRQSPGDEPGIAVGTTRCLGICGLAPVIRCHDRVRVGVGEDDVDEVIAEIEPTTAREGNP